jgi:amino-acid N-acetyltransferase
LIQETRKKEPFGFLDPQNMMISLMEQQREFVVEYVARAMSHFSKRDYLMAAHNTGGHWILLVITTKWNLIWYLDSSRQHDYTFVKQILDE